MHLYRSLAVTLALACVSSGVFAATPNQTELYKAIGPYQWVYPLADYIDGKIAGGGYHTSSALTALGYGDSITANSGTGAQGIACTSATVFCQNALSGNALTWTAFYTGQRIWIPPAYNCGKSGDTAAQALARIDCVLNYHPDLVILEIGANDAAGNNSCDTFAATDRAIVTTLLKAGISVMEWGVYPRSSPSTYTTAQASLAQCYNRRRAQFAMQTGHAGYYFIPVDSIMVDPTVTSSWSAVSGTLVDGVHLSQSGGSAVGYLVAQKINSLYPDWRLPIYSAADVYDATNNPQGNLLPNGLLTGTAGTSLGVCTGTIPSNTLALGPAGGAACAYTVGTLADGRPVTNIAISGTYTGTNQVIDTIQSPTLANINPGDTIQASVCSKIGANTNISGISIRVQSVENGPSYFMDSAVPDVAQSMPAAGFATNDYVCQWTPPRTVLATPSALNVNVNIYLKNGTGLTAGGTVNLTSIALRKVAP